MSFTHTQTLKVKTAGLEVSNDFAKTGAAQASVDESIADSETDKQVTFTLDVSACQSFYMVSDVDILVETNNGAAPDDDISLLAGIPYVWHVGDYVAFKFGTDITALFVTNASGSAAQLQIEALVDPTP